MKSFDPHAYVDEAAAAIALNVPAESRNAVAESLARLAALARDVIAFNAAVEKTEDPASPV